MANYTPNYRLHQWEPEDKFLRTDFNEDFSTIDAALGKTERSARASAYNVYNLMLQSDYEGKYTGYKKALLFDGFQDESGIASRSDAIQWGTGRLILTGTGESDRSMGYGSVGGMDVSTEVYTAAGSGTWTGCTCKVKNSAETSRTLEFRYTVFVNGSTVLSGTQNEGSISYRGTQEWQITFSNGVKLNRGDRFQLKLQTSNSYLALYYQNDNLHLGGTLHVTPRSGKSGQVLTVSHTLPECDGMRAFRLQGRVCAAGAGIRFRGGCLPPDRTAPGADAGPGFLYGTDAGTGRALLCGGYSVSADFGPGGGRDGAVRLRDHSDVKNGAPK